VDRVQIPIHAMPSRVAHIAGCAGEASGLIEGFSARAMRGGPIGCSSRVREAHALHRWTRNPFSAARGGLDDGD
jgi:hypothetical protein